MHAEKHTTNESKLDLRVGTGKQYRKIDKLMIRKRF